MPKVSVVIPVYNYAAHLRKTIESLRAQSFRGFEIIVVDDASVDSSARVARQFADKVIVNDRNSGPAVSRNKGIAAARGEIIAFIDSDCIASKDWLKTIITAFSDDDIDAVMGNTRIPKSTFIGDSISALGFPGGANAGFRNMWKVDPLGFTDHITSCNFAARKKTFKVHGVFDESFPLAGCEDTEIGYRWSRSGVRLKYLDQMLVHHEPRVSMRSFSKWMIYRGRSNYYFKQKVGDVGGFIRLRVWSSWNIVRQNIFDPKIVAIVPLLFLSLILQQYGYLIESRNK